MAKQPQTSKRQDIGIIVTRPKGQSQPLINRLQKSGYSAFDLPGILIVPTRYQKKAIETLSQVENYDYCLFTSPNSVKFGKRLKLDFNKIRAFIAIGSGTENALKPFLKQKEIITAPKPYTSEALVETLKTHGMKDQSVLIISGEGGRRLLDTAIDDLGGSGLYCDVYRREAPIDLDVAAMLDFKKARATRKLYLMISSQEAFNNLLPILEKSGLKADIDGVFVGSERLKSIVETAGFNNIIVARSALENDLWQAIETEFSSQAVDLDAPLTITSDNNKELSMSKEQKQNDTVNDQYVDAIDSTVENQDSKSQDPSSSAEFPSKNRRSRRRNNRKSADFNAPETAQKETEETADKDAAKVISNDTSSDHDAAKDSSSLNKVAKADQVKKADTDETNTNKAEVHQSDADDTKADHAEIEAEMPKADNNADNNQNADAPKAKGQSLTYLALLLALGGLGLGGFSYYKGEVSQSQHFTEISKTVARDQATITALQSEISTLEKTVKALQAKSDSTDKTDQNSLQAQVAVVAKQHDALNQSLSNSAKGLQGQIDALKETQQSLIKKSESIDKIASVSNQAITIANNFDKKLAEQALEQSVVLNEAKSLIATIKNITDLEMLRTTEVDYLLKVAIQKVRFDKDYLVAGDLLSSALDRLNQINSINFSETKALLTENIAALKALKPVDLVTVTGKLEKVVALVQQAPLKDDSALVNLKNEIFKQDTTQGESWTDKLVSSMKHLIVIENKRTEVPELMAKEDRFFLSQNIQLELTAAKVAILQDQYAIFDHSVETVQSWIKTYYDEDNADVREAIQQLQWLLDAPLKVTPPNIERTFTDFEATLRAYKGA